MGAQEKPVHARKARPWTLVVTLPLLAVLVGAWAVSVWWTAGSTDDAMNLTIIYTCDTRGHLDPCGCATGMEGGLSRRKTFIDQHRSDAALIVDAGDVPAGARPWELLEYEYLLKAYALSGYHAVNAGHREAAIDRDTLTELARRFGFLVSANLLGDDGRPVFEPYRIIEVDKDRRVGVIGVMEEDPMNPPGRGLRVAPPMEVLARLIPEVKPKCDVLVVLAFADEAMLRRIAERYFEVDVIVGGRVAQPTGSAIEANRSLIVAETDKGKSVGRLQLVVANGVRSSHENTITTLNDSVPQSLAVDDLLVEYKRDLAFRNFRPSGLRDDAEGLTSLSGTVTTEYIGTAACRACHVKEDRLWSGSGHSHAFHTLEERGYESNPRCLPCHTVGYGTGGYDGDRLTEHLKDVGCESCHGAGGEHARYYSGAKEERRGGGPTMKAVACVTCHNPDNSPRFDRAVYWPKVAH